MIVAVFDTNVLAAGLAGYALPNSAPGELMRRWRANAISLVLSEPILAELARTVQNPYFRRRIAASELEDAFARFRSEGYIQPITIQVVGVTARSHDDLILATALSAEAPFLVTGDKRLRRRGSFQGTRILSPRQFLTVLDSEPGR